MSIATTTTATPTTTPRTLALTCPECRREIARQPFATADQRATAYAWLLGLWRMHAAGRRHPYLLALIAERSASQQPHAQDS